MSTNGLGGFAGDSVDALGSQGSLILSGSRRWSIAVNAGSNSFLIFKIKNQRLRLHRTVNSRGEFPVSLTMKNNILLIPVNRVGVPSGVSVINSSSGSTPFGFAFTKTNQLIIAEAFGGASPGVDDAGAVSSYQLDSDGALEQISGSVTNDQSLSCWIILNPRGRIAYTTNNGSSTMTTYQLNSNRSLV